MRNLRSLWNNEDRVSGDRDVMDSFALVLSKKLEVVGLQPPHVREGRQQGGSAPVLALFAHTRHILAPGCACCGDGTDCAYPAWSKFIEGILQRSAKTAGHRTQCRSSCYTCVLINANC